MSSNPSHRIQNPLRNKPSRLNMTQNSAIHYADQFYGTCRSTARKLVIAVPECRGDPLTGPDGQFIKDRDGDPVDGLVFTNRVASGHPTLQAVRTNGKEVIIFNDLNDDQENKILDALRFTGRDFFYNDGYPNPLNRIRQVIEFAASIGAGDVYNSSLDFVNGKMTYRDGRPLQLQGGRLGNGEQLITARAQRNGEPVAFAVLEKAGTWHGGPTAQAEDYVAGTIAIKNQDGSVHLVHPDMFVKTYQVIEPPKSQQSLDPP